MAMIEAATEYYYTRVAMNNSWIYNDPMSAGQTYGLMTLNRPAPWRVLWPSVLIARQGLFSLLTKTLITVYYPHCD